jgi:FkbM family methyltransferase
MRDIFKKMNSAVNYLYHTFLSSMRMEHKKDKSTSPPSAGMKNGEACLNTEDQESLAKYVLQGLDHLSDEQFVRFADSLKRTRVMDYTHRKIYIGVRSQNELSIGINYCKKEPETVAWIESMPQGSVFYDIGANIGAFSLIAASQNGKISQVVSIEPAYHNFSALVQNIITNGFGNIIIPINCAVADETTIGIFNYRKLMTGSAESVFGRPIDVKGSVFKPIATLRQPAFSLDDLVQILKLPFPTHIKVDVDGIELKIISGAKTIISDPRVQGLMFEASSLEEEGMIRDTLPQHGFTLSMQQKKDLSRAKTKNNYFSRQSD